MSIFGGKNRELWWHVIWSFVQGIATTDRTHHTIILKFAVVDQIKPQGVELMATDWIRCGWSIMISCSDWVHNSSKTFLHAVDMNTNQQMWQQLKTSVKSNVLSSKSPFPVWPGVSLPPPEELWLALLLEDSAALAWRETNQPDACMKNPHSTFYLENPHMHWPVSCCYGKKLTGRQAAWHRAPWWSDRRMSRSTRCSAKRWGGTPCKASPANHGSARHHST